MYSIDEMRRQLADVCKVIADLPSGFVPDGQDEDLMGPARMLLKLEAGETARTLEREETDFAGHLPPAEYAYGRICRLSGMTKAIHFLLVELQTCRR